MRRLQPLPSRCDGRKAAPDKPPAACDDVRETAQQQTHALKEDLKKMMSELDVLEKEELVHHHSQLLVAQERLKQKRKSDLAKRMQESQRLQVLREKKAELEDSRRGKVTAFKQRMILAAEKALERESLMIDTIFSNMGDAMLIAENDTADTDAESVVLDGDRFSFRGPVPGSSIGQPGSAETGGVDFFQFRVPSAFEEHLTHEQRIYSQQLQELKHLHKAPRPATHGGASVAPVGRLPPIPTASAMHNATATPRSIPERPASSSECGERSAGRTNIPAHLEMYQGARQAHSAVREELKRLIAQSRCEDDVVEVDRPLVSVALAHSTAVATIQSEEAIESAVATQLQRIEEKEKIANETEAFRNTSQVPFEDQLHKGNRVIMENAEANMVRQQKVDRELQEKDHKLKIADRSATVRSSMIAAVQMSSASSAASFSPTKGRRESRVVVQDTDDQQTPISPSTAQPPLATATPMSPPPLQHHALSAVIQSTLSEAERHELLMSQQQSRFLAKRASQREELNELRRRLQELEAEEETSQLSEQAQLCSVMPDTADDALPVRVATPAASLADHSGVTEGPHTSQLCDKVDIDSHRHASAALTIQCAVRRRAARTEAAQRRFARRHYIEQLAAAQLAQESSELAQQSSATSELEAREMVRERSSLGASSVQQHAGAGNVKASEDAPVDNALAAEWRELVDLITRENALQAPDPLAEEKVVLASLASREDLLQERYTIDNLMSHEAHICPTPSPRASAHCTEESRSSAAVIIQRHVRGHQVRCWYQEVLRLRALKVALRLETAAVTLQRWARIVLTAQRAVSRTNARRHLRSRYDVLVAEEQSGFGCIAALSIQCFFRRMRTRRLVVERRVAADAEIMFAKESDAAVSIQRGWRNFELGLAQKRHFVRALVESSTNIAAVLDTVGCRAAPGVAVDAAVVIAKYARRFLQRDELRRRWTARVIAQALDDVQAAREEAAYAASSE